MMSPHMAFEVEPLSKTDGVLSLCLNPSAPVLGAVPLPRDCHAHMQVHYNVIKIYAGETDAQQALSGQ